MQQKWKIVMRALFHFCLMLGAVSPAWGAERILDFSSDIVIAPDGSMTVTETIRVNAEGKQIRRGIYRDFPTRYKDRLGNDFVVDFEVLTVTRGGVSESWHTTERDNGVRVYVGSAERLLQPGEYVFQIRYRTNRQLGFFEDHDELYWNVTGNGWGFVIDHVSARVTIPGTVAAKEISVEGYTGRMGASGQAYTAQVQTGMGLIQSTGPLNAREGLTVVVSFPKGIVVEPTWWDNLQYLLRDNLALLASLGSLLLIVWYLYMVWSRYGRDPEPGPIFPHYEPPEGFSPASARFINERDYDTKTFTAAILNMAVNGHLEISNNDNKYALRFASSKTPLAPGEQVLKQALLRKGSTVVLETKNHATLQKAQAAHKKALKRDYQGKYFVTNAGLLLPPIVLTLVLVILLVVFDAFSPVVIGVIAAHGLALILFAHWLEAPTPRGRRFLDQLDGFRMYLEVAEKDDLQRMKSPELTPELFERYLPFAVALDVEVEWAERFASVFRRIAAAQGSTYHPGWYRGDFSPSRLGTFATDVGSGFNSAISSASTAPGSSSGGGGGGSSGGGGGGGGGGGW